MLLDVLLVTTDLKKSDSILHSLTRKSPHLKPVKVSVAVNYAEVVRRVETRLFGAIIAPTAFYTTETRPDPKAWVMLLRELSRQKFRGIFGLTHEEPLPEVPAFFSRSVTIGGVRIFLLNLERFRDPPPQCRGKTSLVAPPRALEDLSGEE